MSSRSTRNKIRHHAQEAINRTDSVLSSLKLIDDLAQGQSPYINKNLPDLVVFLGMLRGALGKFREGL